MNIGNAVSIDLESYKYEALRAARDLGYDNDVVNRIKAAKKESEIVRALLTGRHRMLDDN